MASLQRQRRTNPYPFTWEVPAAVLLCVAYALVMAIHLGRGAACYVATGRWELTPASNLISALPGILTGDASAGLAEASCRATSASSFAVWVTLALLVVTALLVVAGRLLLTRWGPGRMKGLSTAGDAETILGLSRLREVRHIIRPDLHPRKRDQRLTPTTFTSTTPARRRPRFDPTQIGWRIGRALEPRGGDLWCPWDRTCGVIGPQGSGKTLDLLTPALLNAPGAALVTLTKPADLFLSFTSRSHDGRPCLVLDPFGVAPGLPELVWNPIDGCVDPLIAERRAKAFTAGTLRGATSGGSGDSAARFYAAEAAKVLQGYFHAAALTGQTLDTVLAWVANPLDSLEPIEILRQHPAAAPHWHGLLNGALTGDERTASNTRTTVHQAMDLFFQPGIMARCVPTVGRPATDIADVIHRRGTIYLLGREDPYASASPLMTALAEHVLDTALALAHAAPWGRLCPPLLACLDELPSTAPIPTLRTRMANERALGLSFIYAAQTWRQLASLFGEQEARALFGLTNVLVVFGGSKDVAFNREVSELVGTVRVARTTWQFGRQGGRTASGEDMTILKPEEIRQIPTKQALVVPENAAPLIARLHRCIDGRAGRRLLAEQQTLQHQVDRTRQNQQTPHARQQAALALARERGLLDAADPGEW